MLKLGYRSVEDIEDTADILCEQYLPRVYQYINYWADSPPVAEDLTLTVFKKALGRFDNCFRNKASIPVGLFIIARDILNDPHRKGDGKLKTILSQQEQEIISLKLGAEVTNHSIAEIVGISEARVAGILCQALRKLKDGCGE